MSVLLSLSFFPFSLSLPPSSARVAGGGRGVLILPGFGNADVDYIAPLGAPEGLAASLERRGLSPSVLPLKRWEWVRVASGLADGRWWTGTQRADSLAYGWYVRRAREAIEALVEERGGERVAVVAHSAGGWLARAALASGEWTNAAGQRVRASDLVAGLVTLGAPHAPPPDGACATRGALAHTHESFPGAHLKSEGIFYVTVAGAAIEGRKEQGVEREERPLVLGNGAGPDLVGAAAVAAVADGSAVGSPKLVVPPTVSLARADAVYAQRGEGSAARVAYTNYLALIGDGGAVGDGVIPVDLAHLNDAVQVKARRPRSRHAPAPTDAGPARPPASDHPRRGSTLDQ
eukprot:scaffold17234_cov30-Tisochrysis_lutea.AAC.2